MMICLIHFSISPALAAENGQQSTANYTLFMPVVSEAYPELIKELRTVIKQHGLNNVDVKNVDFWHPYQQGLREGRKGVYFAQPHFSAWAINNHQFTPVLKLHGRLKYVLAARRSDDHLFEISDLTGKLICREPGLNLGTVWLNKLLGQHRLTARSKEVPSIANAFETSLKECDAFVIDDHAYERINTRLRGPYIRFAQSPVYKHSAFVAHPSISNTQLRALNKALKSKPAKRVFEAYFKDLSKWQNLLSIKEDDYNAEDALLLQPYWGNDF